MIDVLILTPQKILFEGKASRILLPGEAGTFEVLEFHKPLLSRLLTGDVVIDRDLFPIRRGVVKVASNRMICLVEVEESSHEP